MERMGVGEDGDGGGGGKREGGRGRGIREGVGKRMADSALR